MSTTRPVGSFDYLLAIDCETTGLCFNSDDVTNNPNTGEHHQTVSWGVIVADAQTLKPIEELYVEIKWNQLSKRQRQNNPNFGERAESVHGLSYDYLEENGVTEEEAVLAIGNLIMKYWGPKGNIRTLGHNVHTFDMPFLRDLFRRNGIELSFGNRHYDTNSIGFCTVGSFNSDDLFSTMGMEARQTHNALDDAHMALESARRIRTLWNDMVGIKAYPQQL